ncbi:hypothetical protein GCM10023196_106300 [Actinoallomurus vinaceus]|uniref:Glycosyltransferase n=1 Tax=Actinoallomurus vinaceus TaxID=1080074 RepID=A0ABP8UUL7_9ACTN
MSDIRISAAVMAHPSRAENARKVAGQCPELEPRIVFDPDPGTPGSTLRTALLAWETIPDAATHHLVLQDDVLLCADFSEEVAAAVASRPDSPLFLFTDWGTRAAQTLRLAALGGRSWAEVIDEVVPAQAILLPASMVAEFVAFVAAHPEIGDDDAVSMRAFLDARQATAFVSVPNLVEHQGLPSLLGNDLLMGHRRSPCFGHPPRSASSWSSAAVECLTVVPHFWTGRSICCVRENGRWEDVTTHHWLTRNGMPLPEQIERFEEAVDAAPVMPTVQETISRTLVFEFWLTAFMFGAVAASLGDDLPAAVKRPLARRSLDTLLAGGLRRLLAPERIVAVSAEFTPLLHAGIEAGASAGLFGTAS